MDSTITLLYPVLLVLLLIVPVLLIMFLHKKQSPKPKLPPGPPKLPLIGNLHQVGKLPHHSLWQLSQQHGPLLYLQLGQAPTIIISSSDLARQVLRTHDLESCSRPSLFSSTKLSYGCSDVAFIPHGDQWRELKKICVVELFGTKNNSTLQSIREEEVESMVTSISAAAAASMDCAIDLSDIFLSCANNITLRAAFGKRYQITGKYEWSKLHMMLTEVQAALGSFFMADYIPCFAWIDILTGARARLDKIFYDLDAFYELIIDEHLQQIMQSHGQDEDILHTLLRLQKETDHLTNDNIKGVLMDIFVAGSDTSSASLEWTMAELMRNPETMKKAQDEVRKVIGMKGKVEESDLQQLQYLKWVLKESMRLHPPAPLLVHRETTQHFKINGYEIQPKTRVIVNAWAIGRETSSWERPLEFYPERFKDSSIDMKGHDFQLIPFGAGRRICPGIDLGIQTVELALANLLYTFDWKCPDGSQDINLDETPGVTVHKKYPLFLVPIKYELK
ncbi:cytochrome P450 71A1-like [Dioscorea cayenensis subsp. rotundata]|uniref:Cytochrome P450 71A1-like n=1 Tax=Dioscorea cayennensis subsp. rotundata TaxID=55577 RepID=A0AB40CH46_DIOCR|nr:cytochrome P450 71A1-like [Dioscorea cayenensis subsp. rotundata]